MNAGLEDLERRPDTLVGKQSADFHWLLGIMLGGFGATLAVMAYGFHWF